MNFQKLSSTTRQNNNNFVFLGGAYPWLLGLVATKWVPMGAGACGVSPNDDTNRSPREHTIFRKR